MKHSFIVSAVLVALAGCSQLPEQAPAPITEVSEPLVAAEPDLVENEVLNDNVAQAQATDFGHIFIDRDMSFIGTLPCEGCPGVKYHVNLFQDGKFEARQEFIDQHEVNLVKGTWLLEGRVIHLMSQQTKIPHFSLSAITKWCSWMKPVNLLYRKITMS